MKIIVAGAGIGGVYVAGLLSKAGHEVVLYEKSAGIEFLRHDQGDDVDIKAFIDNGIEIPQGAYPKKNWTFVGSGENKLRLVQKYEYIDYTIDRKKLNEILFSMIGDTKVIFNATVTKAVTEGDRVIGAEVNLLNKGKIRVFCDLLIDASGVYSSVRKSLKDLSIPQVNKDETFCAYRAYFNLKEVDVKVKETNKVYMKHMGKDGISWCLYNKKEKHADVLIGRVGELTDEDVKESLADIRNINPFVGEKVIRGGHVAVIPVRRPLSKCVLDGYVAIGDSACMTVPMIGSGIATSIISAKILFDVLENKKDASIENLWQYQVAVFQAFGFQHCGVEVIKSWMLKQKLYTVDWFLTSGILKNKDMQEISIGKMPNFTLKDYMQKLYVGLDHPTILFSMCRAMMRANSAIARAKKIPKVYSEKKVNKWQKKLDGFYAYIK